jgi:hypothetical protein
MTRRCCARRISRRPILEPRCPLRCKALVSPGFSHVWPVPLEFWCAHAGSVHGGMQRCISRRAPQIESFFESHESLKYLGFCMAQSGTAPCRSRGWDSNYLCDLLKQRDFENKPKRRNLPSQSQ